MCVGCGHHKSYFESRAAGLYRDMGTRSHHLQHISLPNSNKGGGCRLCPPHSKACPGVGPQQKFPDSGGLGKGVLNQNE